MFFAELGAYLRHEPPARLATAQCFVVLRGPTAGGPMTQAGLWTERRRYLGLGVLARSRMTLIPDTSATTDNSSEVTADNDLKALSA